MQPKLMLFDEVTALDPELIKGGLDVMAVLASEGMTMVVVTTRWASPGGDSRVQFLDQGVVLEEGEPTRMFGDRSIGRVPRRRPRGPGRRSRPSHRDASCDPIVRIAGAVAADRGRAIGSDIVAIVAPSRLPPTSEAAVT